MDSGLGGEALGAPFVLEYLAEYLRLAIVHHAFWVAGIQARLDNLKIGHHGHVFMFEIVTVKDVPAPMPGEAHKDACGLS